MHMNMQKYELRFYLLIHFQLLNFVCLIPKYRLSYIQKNKSQIHYKYIHEYAHSFFGMDFKSDTLYWLDCIIYMLQQTCGTRYSSESLTRLENPGNP